MLVYVNGEYVDAAEARISVYDRGFMLGDGIFDTWRTYGGAECRRMVDKHLARVRRSVNFMEMDGAAIAAEIGEAATELVARNHDEILTVGDIWLVPVVSRGEGVEMGAEPDHPTRVIVCRPIFVAGELYEHGGHLITSTMVQNPFGAVDPRVKTISRLGYVRGERKQRRAGPGNWVLFVDNNGFITEASGANLALIEGETIVKPPRWSTLGGISLDTFCELGRGLGYPIEERQLTLYDFLNADGAYLLATSVAVVPVADIDGIPVAREQTVGPAILKAWIEYVDFDFVAQAQAQPAVTR
jgi:branched-chain amino acid aminotransferase